MVQDAHDSAAPADLNPALRRLGLLGPAEVARWLPLAGGVSSDIWKVETPTRVVCVKRARARLAVASPWYAPVERNEAEVAWLEMVHRTRRGAVPRVLGHAPEGHLFVMEYLDPARCPGWKSELAAGRVDPAFARRVGETLGDIHADTAGDAALALRFATDACFASLRIEPYFASVARAHPDLAPAIDEIASRTVDTRRVVVHGDVSPKNLLVGPDGPIFLDAECAWFGDPAFDVAFCLTHLLLKCRLVPARSEHLLRSFHALAGGYATRVRWEEARILESRVAALLPALLLARIDGTSAVEYLTDDRERAVVRSVARELLRAPPDSLRAVAATWRESLGR